jgi:hypothetical protein
MRTCLYFYPIQRENEIVGEQLILYVIQNYSEFKLNLNLTVPLDGRTTRQSDSNWGFVCEL